MFFFLCAAAMNQIAKNFACEWAKDNIRSNSVAPWYIKTSLVEDVISLILLMLFLDCFIFQRELLIYSENVFIFGMKHMFFISTIFCITSSFKSYTLYSHHGLHSVILL